MNNISLKIKVEFCDGTYSEPKHIFVVYYNERHYINFECVKKNICNDGNSAEFSLENPYISVIGKKVLLDRCDLTHILAKAQKIELCFNQDVDNILYCKSKIIEKPEHWSCKPVEFPVKLNVKNIKKTDITDKQWKYIFDIEDKLDVCFNGVTKSDAREFIGKYNSEMRKRVVSYASEPSVCVWDEGMAWERMESY
jgi:hypothetical protein